MVRCMHMPKRRCLWQLQISAGMRCIRVAGVEFREVMGGGCSQMIIQKRNIFPLDSAALHGYELGRLTPISSVGHCDRSL